MRVKLLPIFALIILVVFPSVASAQVSSSSATTSATTRDQIKTANREALQEKKQQLMTNIQEKRAAYQEKLATIKDEQKKMAVERVDSKIASVNTNQTTRLNSVLEKLATKLQTLKEKAAIAQAAGKDTTAVYTAIASAETALVDAKTAIDTQAAKEYAITINTESRLKRDVGTVISGFRADMQATHKTVVNAKQAIMQVVQELAVINGIRVASDSATTN